MSNCCLLDTQDGEDWISYNLSAHAEVKIYSISRVSLVRFSLL